MADDQREESKPGRIPREEFDPGKPLGYRQKAEAGSAQAEGRVEVADDVIDKLIEDKSDRASPAELEKRGVKSVKYLDAKTLHNLIEEAVRSVLDQHPATLSRDQLERINRQSRDELKRLMRQHQSVKASAKQSKAELIKQIESLEKQLDIAVRMQAQEVARAYEEGAASQEGAMDELHARIEELENQAAEYLETIEALRREIAGLKGEQVPDREAVAQLAFRLYEERGCAHGGDEEDWYASVEALSQGGSAAAKD